MTTTPTTLRRLLGGCTAAVTLLGLTATASAGACRQPRAAVAMQTAAVQQQLMVAALSCHQSRLYNAFVIGHRDELRRSDAELRRYFEHRHGGMPAYHAYKTRLANSASLDSLHDIDGYCADAREVFQAARTPGRSLGEVLGLSPDNDDCTRIAERGG